LQNFICEVKCKPFRLAILSVLYIIEPINISKGLLEAMDQYPLSMARHRMLVCVYQVWV
jgi:hypothetical protein